MSGRKGFFLSWLRLTGPEVQPAQVEFKLGLNVLWGASETGKSFIFSCIDFMFGRESPPKNIAEIEGYTTVWLALTDYSGNQRVLERSLRGGDFRLHVAHGEGWTLSEPQDLRTEHDPARTDTISHWLLSTAGFQDATILSGIEKRQTRGLSFRDVAHFVLVDEDRIIAERSPVYPKGQWVNETAELATFSHIISGMDWAEVIAKPDIKLEKARWRGKKELYEQLIAEIRRAMGEGPPPLDEIERAIEDAGLKIQESLYAIDRDREDLARMMEVRKGHWEAVQGARSRMLVVEQLLQRFELLKKQYESDLGAALP